MHSDPIKSTTSVESTNPFGSIPTRASRISRSPANFNPQNRNYFHESKSGPQHPTDTEDGSAKVQVFGFIHAAHEALRRRARSLLEINPRGTDDGTRSVGTAAA